VIVIAALRHRSQEQNRKDARERLFEMIREAAKRPVPRRATKPPKASRERRLETKARRSKLKRLRSTRSFD
jgi:ribosome-associated protein